MLLHWRWMCNLIEIHLINVGRHHDNVVKQLIYLGLSEWGNEILGIPLSQGNLSRFGVCTYFAYFAIKDSYYTLYMLASLRRWSLTLRPPRGSWRSSRTARPRASWTAAPPGSGSAGARWTAGWLGEAFGICLYSVLTVRRDGWSIQFQISSVSSFDSLINIRQRCFKAALQQNLYLQFHPKLWSWSIQPRKESQHFLNSLSPNLAAQMWCLHQQLPSENAAFDGPQGRKWTEGEREREPELSWGGEETFSARNFFCPFWIRSQKEERRVERGKWRRVVADRKIASISLGCADSNNPQMLAVNYGSYIGCLIAHSGCLWPQEHVHSSNNLRKSSKTK